MTFPIKIPPYEEGARSPLPTTGSSLGNGYSLGMVYTSSAHKAFLRNNQICLPACKNETE